MARLTLVLYDIRPSTKLVRETEKYIKTAEIRDYNGKKKKKL